MKIFNKSLLALSSLGVAFGLFASLSTPVDTAGFSLIGGSLGTGQRDFRVFNNFTDSQANNNTNINVAFPGAMGATQAIWKGHLEWSSGWYMGTGTQDPTQSRLGTGVANYDNNYQGETTGTGGTNDNIHSELFDSSPGGTLAFTETPISNGWRIRYLSGWTWEDGPGNVGSKIDLQGVAGHEIGQAWGLGHSSVSGATMLPSISGTGVPARSINSDDTAGLRTIYGNLGSSKPLITAISGSTNPGGTLTILGSNFSNNNNVVWFTDTGNGGSALTVNGVSSSSGGTVINVTIPSGADDGSVMVKANFSGGESLSNEWALDIGSGGAGDPPLITSVSPSSGPAGGSTAVTIGGSGFNGTTDVTLGGTPAMSFTVNSGSSISATTPAGTAGSSVDVTVTDNEGSSTDVNGFTYTADPPPNLFSVSPNSGAAEGGVTVTVFGSNVLGVTSVTFGGVPGTNLTLIDSLTLTVDTPAGLGSVNVTATNSTGSDTLVGGYTHVPGGSFVNCGASGIGGSLGEPVMTGSGDLTPGSSAGFTVTISNAQPFAQGFVFFGLQDNPTPFFGGTFHPIPWLQSLIFPMNASGSFSGTTTLDPTFPGSTSLYLQTFFLDASAPQGISGSNCLELQVP